MQYGGATGPIWASPQGLTIGYANTAGIATYATKAGIATYADNAGLSTNLKSGSAGSIPYQTGSNATTFLSAGSNGQLLQYLTSSSSPSWVSLSDLTATNANYATNAGIATNLKSGSAGSIPYQTGSNATTFLSAGSNGQLLQYLTSSSSPSWVSLSDLTATNANYATNAGIATNLKSVTTNKHQIPYQAATNQTLFTDGTGAVNGYLLEYHGTSIAPGWVAPTNLTVQNANYATNAGIATNLKSISANNYGIPYQSAPNITSFLTVGAAGSILSSNGSGSPPQWINVNTTASKSIVASDTTDNSRYITFVPDIGSQNLGIDKSHLIYNPSSNILSAQKISITNILSGSTTIATFNANGQQVTSFSVGTAAPSGTAGEIRATNNITAYYSDERLKENIKPIPSALSKLLTLRGVTYNSNELAEQYGYMDKKEQVGVIAQEVEKVLPQIVVPAPFDIAQDADGNEYSKSGENYKTVQYDKLVPLLIEAIKEQQETIINLQRRIEDLEK